MAWFGADPGGVGKFGVALLRADGTFVTAVVNCASEADQYLNSLSEKIDALGIDAPLWWSSGPRGDRKADVRLRRHYRNLGASVMSLNSLRGAALVQGVMLAELVRRTRPQLPITECHPKALLKAFRLDPSDNAANWPAIVSRFALSGPRPESDDERDALIAAVAAGEGANGRWVCDLSKRRSDFEQDPAAVPWGPVHYWWPDVVAEGA